MDILVRSGNKHRISHKKKKKKEKNILRLFLRFDSVFFLIWNFFKVYYWKKDSKN
jgi:hypothetical protein